MQPLKLFASPLGRFDRVNLGFLFRSSVLHVGRQVAAAVLPLHGRIRKCRAEPTGVELFAAVASAAGLDDFSA